MISFRRKSAYLRVAVLGICACTLSAEPGTIYVDASTAAAAGAAADGALRHEPVRSPNTAVDDSPSTTLSGLLEAIVVDDFAQDTSEMLYYLRGDDGTGRQIHFPAAPRLRPGVRLTVTGQTVGEVFFAYGYEDTLPSVSVPAGSADGDLHVIGEQFTLVLLLNFLDDLSEPNTVAEVEDLIFNDSNPLSVNSRLRENSYGKAWLAGDVLDWVTLPINAGACAGYLRPFSSIFQNTVDFVDDLVDFSLYTRIIVLKPSNDCTVGAVGSFGDFPIATDEGQFQVSLAVGVLAPSANMPATISHELGHNYEMTHHGAIECGDAAVGDYADGCDNIQRGRPYDPMARSGQGHHNASSKHRLGWFDPQNIAALGTGTHEITLFPLELPSDQVQTVRIPAAYILHGGSESAYYVIEYRQAIGLDASHTELDDPQAGVLLNLEERDYLLGPVLLDMSPHVTTEDFSQSEDIEEDAFLRLGQTFTDTKHGITVTFSGVAAGAAVLTIDVPRLCDDGICDPGEDSCSCPTDCGPPDPADCTLNGIPDECEPDCNNNGVADSCEIADDPGADCPGGNGNGILDECEPQVDCNGNGVIDSCDIAGDARGDLNANGIPDDCEPHEMVHVNMGNCPGPGSGTVQNPFCNIQDAIDAQNLGAGENDVVEIIVADGVYTGERNMNLDFAGRLITVRSANGPDNCIIDMQGEGRGFNFHSGESAGARLEGLTIRNGSFGTHFESIAGGIYCHESSPTIVDCTITGNTVEGIGGGIVAESRSNPAIINCRITDNVVSNTWGSLFGGGIACLGSSPSISGCVISNNAATGTFSAGRGGGIYLWGHSNPTITGCTISSNTVFGAGGGIYCRQNSNPTIRDCLITNNSATAPAGIGGGIFVFKARPTLDSCTITGNTAPLGAGIGIQEGDMIQESEVRIVIRNCLIASNDAGNCGGGIGVLGASTATIQNCTITGNTSDFEGGGICLSENPGRVIDMIVTNSILWGNIAQGNTNELAQIFTDASALTINFSDIQGLTGALGGVANIGDDPRFVSGTDLRLTECSPCIDAGDNSAVTGSSDLDGNPRIANGVVDMGAYEAAAVGDCPCPTCLSDAHCNDGDACTVDVCDESCQCVHTPTFNVGDECCDPASGQVVLIDDDDPCTIDMCDPSTGQVGHTDRPDCILFDADAFPKNRYVSFETGVLPVELAFHVRMTASAHFPESIGDLGWVGVPDSKGTALVVPDPVFLPSWPAVVRAGDCEIVPAATYEIRATGDGVNFDPPVVVETTAPPTGKFWGDIVGDFNGVAWTPPNGVLNFVDVQAAIKTFQGGASTAPLIWADLEPETPNRVVNFNEVLWLILAFTGEPYPFRAPTDCP